MRPYPGSRMRAAMAARGVPLLGKRLCNGDPSGDRGRDPTGESDSERIALSRSPFCSKPSFSHLSSGLERHAGSPLEVRNAISATVAVKLSLGLDVRINPRTPNAFGALGRVLVRDPPSRTLVSVPNQA